MYGLRSKLLWKAFDPLQQERSNHSLDQSPPSPSSFPLTPPLLNTDAPTVRTASIRVAIIRRIVHALLALRALDIRNATAEYRHDADARTVDRHTARLGVVDADLTGGTRPAYTRAAGRGGGRAGCGLCGAGLEEIREDDTGRAVGVVDD